MTQGATERGDAQLRRRVIAAAALGSVVVAVAGVAARSSLDLTASYPWKAVAGFSAVMAAAALFLREHPFPRLGPANQVTVVRAGLLAAAAASIGEPVTRAVAWVGVAAAIASAVLDGVDGWLARRSRMASAFGARFDMETDALLMLVMSALVWQHQKAGVWVLAGGLMRYLFVASRWIFPWMGGRLTPTLRGKTVAVAHLVGLIVALAPIVPYPLSAAAAAITLLALTWSFATDVGRLWRQRTVMEV